MQNWIDLSPYNMRLMVAVLPTTKVLLIDNVPVEHQSAVAAMGFKKRDGKDAWVKPFNNSLSPYDFQRVLPLAKPKKMETSEFVIRYDAAQQADKNQNSTLKDIPAAVVLGYNRLGQQIVLEDGRRYINGSGKGKRINEAAIATSAPGMFLRAVDEGSIAMCAEGYIETAILGKGESYAELPAFMKTIQLDESKKDEFLQEISAAAIRHVSRKGNISLRDRFGKALDIRNALSSFDFGDHEHFDKLILARRLLGLEKDLIGNALYQDTKSTELLTSLLPKAVRAAEKANEADFLALFPTDTASLQKALASRQQGAMSISFIPVKSKDEASELVKVAAKAGPVEGAAFVSTGDATPYLAVTSYAGDASTLIPEVQELKDAGELWSWASLIASNRGQSIEALKSGLSTEADLNSATNMAKNAHQIPYKSASKVGTPMTMVPKELEEPTRQALDRIISNFGDIDSRVARECGFSKTELEDVLSPEQVDGVALAIHAEERDRAFLLADNTGVGKGRALMTLAKRAVLQGKKVLVLTERAANLSDLMRDVKHIKALDDIRPAVMNQTAKLIDEATGEEFETASREGLDQAVADGAWPEDTQVIFATYSQFNQSPDDSARSKWLVENIGEDVVVIADEIHNAASGDSNTSKNVAVAIANCGSLFMSSATFAGDAKMMAYFERLFPEGISAQEISAMMRKGGEPFQEVIAAMLVADGVMIRREKDLSTLEITQLLDETRQVRNREHMDAFAAVIGEMAALSGDMDFAVETQNAQEGNVLKGLQAKRMGFGSPLYTMARLFTASLLAEFSAERAIEALKNGEKPIILVENTIQSVLEEAGDTTGAAPDFKDVVHRIVRQLTKVSFVQEDGETVRVDLAEDNATVLNKVSRIRDLIDQLPDLPASAIDTVKQKIRDAGYSCGEITGRTLEVVDGQVVSRKDRDTTKSKNAFNRGDLDALVINSAGSTGIDLHAGSRFKDQRRRVMIELQGPAYVLKQIQAFGRISRYDEVVASRIEVPSTGLPVEVRLSAMRNQKLRRLSANVTSNRDSIYLTRNIPDLINSVGDEVISRYAEMRPDLVKRLCLSHKFEENTNEAESDGQSENQRDNDRSANEFLSRLMLLPTEHQEKVLTELTAEYELHVAELEAKGENPLRPKELEGIVHIRKQTPFEGSAAAGAITAFDGQMNLMDVSIERIQEPVRAEAVMEAVEKGSENYGKILKIGRSLLDDRDLYLEPFLPKSAKTVADALAKGFVRISRMAQNMNDLVITLEQLAPGRQVKMNMGGGEFEEGIITDISVPPKGYAHLPHMYRVGIAVPGATKIRTYSMETLIHSLGVGSRDKEGNLTMNVSEGLDGNDYDAVLEKFETAVARKHTSAKMLTTNIFRAVRLATQHNLGSLVSFVDSEGNRHRGILVKKGFERNLHDLSVRLDGVASIVATIVDSKGSVTSSPTNSTRAVRISPIGSSSWQISMPRPRIQKGDTKWPNEAFRELFERGTIEEKTGFSKQILTGEEDLRNAVAIMAESGFKSFYMDGKYRSQLSAHEDLKMGGMTL